MVWAQKDLDNLKTKGLKVDDKFRVSSKMETTEIKPKTKIEKVSVEKNTIEFILMSFKQKELITDFVTEHKFDRILLLQTDGKYYDTPQSIAKI